MNKEIYIWRASKEELEVKIVYRSTQPEMLDLMERKYEAEQEREITKNGREETKKA